MTEPSPEHVTRLAELASAGDDAAAEELLPMDYDELPSESRPSPPQGAVDAATIGRWGLAAESRRGSR